MNIENTKNDVTQDINKRSLWSELETLGYTEEQIKQLFIFMETLPIHQLSDDSKKVKVMICKGHIVVI